jgi:hypothetical protein
MRLGITILAGAALLGLAPAHAEADRGAAELAKLLEGRTAGEPVKCLNQRDIRSTRIIDGTAIVYETSGDVLYVNTPKAGARSLDKWDVLVTDTHSSRLCDIDVVRLYDPTSRMQSGFVNLSQFVPYRKTKG